MITGEEVAEHIEMGGREAREKLAMKLPKFGAPQVAKPARRTDSLLSEVCALMYRRLSLQEALHWGMPETCLIIISCNLSSSR